MDAIDITGLCFNAVIGTMPHERLRRQRVSADLHLELDLAKAAAADDLTKSVDYAEIERRTAELGERSRFLLLEALAGAILDLVFEYDLIQRASVKLTKPAAPARAQAITVTLNRERAKGISL